MLCAECVVAFASLFTELECSVIESESSSAKNTNAFFASRYIRTIMTYTSVLFSRKLKQEIKQEKITADEWFKEEEVVPPAVIVAITLVPICLV
jgi:hypothetical protein